MNDHDHDKDTNNIHYHFHFEGLATVFQMFTNQFLTIIENQKIIMSKQDQINATLQELNDATNAIADRIQKLIDAGADNITQESLDALQKDADTLKAMGTDASNPIPPVA